MLPLVRPVSSHSRRRLVASTSTCWVDPIDRWKRSDWIDRCSACSATMRRVFSSSVTSSGIRFDASVFGRSEYLKEKMLW